MQEHEKIEKLTLKLIESMNAKDEDRLREVHQEWLSTAGSVWLLGVAIHELSAWGVEKLLALEYQPKGMGIGPFVELADTFFYGTNPEKGWAVWDVLMANLGEVPVAYSLLALVSPCDDFRGADLERSGLRERLKGQWEHPHSFGQGVGLLTPLQLAWFKQSPALCKLLMDMGASPETMVAESAWPGWSLLNALSGRTVLRGDEPSGVQQLIPNRQCFHGWKSSGLESWAHGVWAERRQASLHESLPPSPPKAPSLRF